MPQTIISNKEGKQFALFMVSGTIVFGLILLKFKGFNHSKELLILLGILDIIFLMFTFKSLQLINGKLIVFYPIRPFLRRKELDYGKIKKIKYRLFSGGTHYPYIQIFSSKVPWLIEFRIKRNFDVDQFIETCKKSGDLELVRDQKKHILIPKI